MFYSIKGTISVEVKNIDNFCVFLKPSPAYIAPFNKKFAVAFKYNPVKKEILSISREFDESGQCIKVVNVKSCLLGIFLAATTSPSKLVEVFVDKDWKITKVRFPAS